MVEKPGPSTTITSMLADTEIASIGSAPMGLYVHVPFCEHRCGYCAFVTTADGKSEDFETYVNRVSTELDGAAATMNDRTALTTVYFGGGTPTHLPAPVLCGLIKSIKSKFETPADVEVTIEANPESVTPDYLARLVDAGATRISLGMQSVSRNVLRILDRHPDPLRALEAVDWAKSAGIQSVSLDLIGGTPGETDHDFDQSVEAAAACGAQHVSMYLLAVERGTPLQRRILGGEVPAPDSDAAADRYLSAEAILTAHGFANYEISNWSNGAQHQCRHNLGYWKGHHYWGVGPGAHSFLGGRRWWNTSNIDAYLAGKTLSGTEVTTPEQQRIERVMLGVRLAEGLDVAALRIENDPDTTTIADRIATLEQRGLVTTDSDRLVLTLSGRLVADDVITQLIGSA